MFFLIIILIHGSKPVANHAENCLEWFTKATSAFLISFQRKGGWLKAKAKEVYG